jgi:hypothetical protein
MLRPTKPLPRIGARAAIRHFGGQEEAVTVIAVRDDGRVVEVEDAAGTRHSFSLRRATAAFVLTGEQHAPRLLL